MTTEIKAWTIGNDSDGNVQLNIYIEGVHHTLNVHDRDVESMQNIVNMKSLFGERHFCMDYRTTEGVRTIGIGKMMFEEALKKGKHYCELNQVEFICIKKDPNY